MQAAVDMGLCADCVWHRRAGRHLDERWLLAPLLGICACDLRLLCRPEKIAFIRLSADEYTAIANSIRSDMHAVAV